MADLGSIALGVFGLWQGAKALHRGFTSGNEVQLAEAAPVGRQLPGRGPVGRSGVRQGAAKVKTYEVRNLDDRIRHIAGMAKKGRLDPRMREFTVKLVSTRCGSTWCTPEKNWRKEAETVFNGLRGRYYRYVRDTYGVDLYQHPLRTIDFGGGDCDDATVLLASALGSIGFKVKARVIQTKNAEDWDHIYCLVEIPGTGGAGSEASGSGATWMPMDLSMNKPPGWEAPASMVKRRRDYSL